MRKKEDIISGGSGMREGQYMKERILYSASFLSNNDDGDDEDDITVPGDAQIEVQ